MLNLSQRVPEGVKSRLRPIKKSLKQVFSIFAPKLAARSNNPYATHLPVLIGLSRLLAVKRVLELGCGKYSTLTFLNKDIFPVLEVLDSFENDLEWANEMKEITRGDPRIKIRLIDKPMSEIVPQIDFQEYDLIFVDDSVTVDERTRTIYEIAKRKTAVKAVVIHDYENKSYREAAKEFSYRFKFDALNPNTGLVWNGEAISTAQLKAMHVLIRKYSHQIILDDFHQWIRIFDKK
jgi:hypothetical protein